jgi:hypothetical protein
MQNPPFKLFDSIERFKTEIGTNNLFLEIGSDRGSNSSYFLFNLAKESGNDFVTVDVDPIYLNSNIKAFTMKGEDFINEVLPSLKEKVSLVYMDGFDWTSRPVDVRSGSASPDSYNLISEYAKKHEVLNNVNSAVTHTKQILELLPHLASKCAIMFCDTWFNYTLDTFEGKGAGGVYVLLSSGFEIISASAKSPYILLARGLSAADLPNLNLDALSKVHTGVNRPPNQIIYSNDD